MMMLVSVVSFLLFTACENCYSYEQTTSVEKTRVAKLVCLNNAQAQDLNILILPEAYRREDMRYFEQDAKKVLIALKNTKPYSYMMDRLNVWYSTSFVSESNELNSGLTAFGCGSPHDRRISLNEDSLTNALQKTMLPKDRTVLLVLINTDAYIGYAVISTDSDTPSQAICSANDGYIATTALHELGHAIGYLDDEYDEGGIPATEATTKYLQKEHERGWSKNVSASSKDVYWQSFIDDDAFASEKTGVYIGGAGYINGVYRSTKNSIMRSHVPYYNGVSRMLIYQRMMLLHTDIEPSYADFKVEDTSHLDLEWNWQEINKPTNPQATRALSVPKEEKLFCSHSPLRE